MSVMAMGVAGDVLRDGNSHFAGASNAVEEGSGGPVEEEDEEEDEREDEREDRLVERRVGSRGSEKVFDTILGTTC